MSPAGGCLGGVGGGTAGETSSDGAVSTYIGAETADPGEALELAVRTADGQRVFHEWRRLRLEVYVHTDRVVGVGSAFDAIAAEYRDSSGVLIGQAEAVVGPHGALDVRLRNELGREVPLEPGGVVSITDAQEQVLIDVEELNFDFDSTLGLFGQAPPGREVSIDLLLRDGRLLLLSRQAGTSGHFRYGPSDILPRATW